MDEWKMLNAVCCRQIKSGQKLEVLHPCRSLLAIVVKIFYIFYARNCCRRARMKEQNSFFQKIIEIIQNKISMKESKQALCLPLLLPIIMIVLLLVLARTHK
jgi:hypothetical protein